MRKNIATLLLIFLSTMILIAGCSAKDCEDFIGSETTRQKDLDSSFSIAIPNSWSVERSRRDESSELVIKAAESCKITILMTSRNLNANEKSISSVNLIDKMINSSIDNLKSKGQNVMDYGKYRSFKDTFPSFIIVSAAPDETRAFASYGAISDERNLSIIVSTRNKQHSNKLAGFVKSLIDSVEFY